MIDFSAMLSIPGPSCLDNAVNGLQGAMQSFNNHLKLAVSVCKFLRFKGAILLGRWGAINPSHLVLGKRIALDLEQRHVFEG